eukprot:EG_transcript_7073
MAEALLAALPPSLLNAANQALAQRLRAEAAQLGQQQRRLAAAHRALQERTQYVADLRGQAEEVRGLARAKQEETERAEHAAKVAARQADKLQQEHGALLRSGAEVAQALERVERRVVQARGQAAAQQAAGQGRAELLEQWNTNYADVGAAAADLARLARQDAAQLAELQRQRDALQLQVKQAERSLGEEQAEGQGATLSLQRVAAQQEALKEERASLLADWEALRQQLRRKEVRHRQLADRLRQEDAAVEAREAELSEARQLLAALVADGLRSVAELRQRPVEARRGQRQALQEAVQVVADEADVCRAALLRATVELHQKRGELLQRRRALEDGRARLAALQARATTRGTALKSLLGTVRRVEGYASGVATFHRQLAAALEALGQDVARLVALRQQAAAQQLQEKSNEDSLAAQLVTLQQRSTRTSRDVRDAELAGETMAEQASQLDIDVQALGARVAALRDAAAAEQAERQAGLERRAAGLQQAIDELCAEGKARTAALANAKAQLRTAQQASVKGEEQLSDKQDEAEALGRDVRRLAAVAADAQKALEVQRMHRELLAARAEHLQRATGEGREAAAAAEQHRAALLEQLRGRLAAAEVHEAGLRR